MTTKTIKLASGYELPEVGYGLWKIPKDKAAEAVYNAIKLGYRHFDGAYDYQNEKEAGEGIRKAIADGLVTREEVFVTTKLWNNYHAKEHAVKMGNFQNDTWGLGYIDLFLIHFPIALKYVDPKEIEYPGWWTDKDHTNVELAKVSISETWKALETLVDDGIVRSIGISNCQAQTIYDIETYNRYPISSIQIEHHPYLVQNQLVKLAKKKNIAFVAYSSYGPQSFLTLPPDFSELAKSAKPLFTHDEITSIATKKGKTPAQILLRWATQRGIAVIPKASSDLHLKQNLDLGFDLSDAELKSISSLDLNFRFNDPGFYLKDHPLHIFG